MMSTTTGFFNDGASYERLMGRWSRMAGDIFLDWLALPKGLRWLDVGCGNGAFTEAIIARTAPAEVIGVDPSEGQLGYARTRPGARPAEFRVASALELPFAADRFDAAIMALVISFVPDPYKAAAEMVRVVRPGGMVATYMWDGPGGGLPTNPVHEAMGALGMKRPQSPSFEVSRADRMRDVWEKAGLQSIEARVIRIPLAYADFADFWDSNALRGGPVGKAVSEMPPADVERLKAQLRKQLPTGPDGRIAYEAFANAVKGRVA